jgi:hypothetical protein
MTALLTKHHGTARVNNSFRKLEQLKGQKTRTPKSWVCVIKVTIDRWVTPRDTMYYAHIRIMIRLNRKSAGNRFGEDGSLYTYIYPPPFPLASGLLPRPAAPVFFPSHLVCVLLS